MKKIFALLLLCALCRAGEGYAQLPSDSVRIYYRQGHRDVDPSFGENRTELDRFLRSVRRACAEGHVNRLVIRSYASPDGINRSNERLSRLRADSMESYVLRHTAIPASMVEKHAEGIAWEQLRELVAASEGVPCRDEVLEVLDNTPLWIFDDAGRIVDGRKKRLMSLRGGVPYNYMLEHLFPVLRNSAAASLYTKDYARAAQRAADAAVAAALAAAASAECAETAAAEASRLAEELEALAGALDPAVAGDAATLALSAATEARTAARRASKAAARARSAAETASVAAVEAEQAEKRSDSEEASRAAADAEKAAREAVEAAAAARAAEDAARAAAEEARNAAARVASAAAALREGEARPTEAPDPLHRLAVKTNLLYDIALMPSLEVEWRIDDRWSVAVEGDVAWWRNSTKQRFYQVAAIVPEGRYWFSARKPWHGHYVGLFAGGTWYDLENGGPGYRGEAFLAGVSYGYMWPVSRSLSFEAGIGVGYAYAKYEKYRPQEGHYLYQQTKRTNYFGPLKLKLALVWRLWDKNREKGGVR